MSNYAETTRRLNEAGIDIGQDAVERFLKGTSTTSQYGPQIFAAHLAVTREAHTDQLDALESAFNRIIEHGTPIRGGKRGPRQTAA